MSVENSRESPSEDPSTSTFAVHCEPEEVVLIMPKTEPGYPQAEDSIKEEYREYHDIKQKICTEELKSSSEDNNILYKCEDSDILYKCTDWGKTDSITIPGDKQVKCSICNKEISAKSNLIRHRRIHNNKKELFQCDICMKGFSEKSYLVIHLRTHRPEKTFQCPICNGKYSHPGSFKDHVKVQHTKEYEDQLYTICGRLFVDGKCLEVHLGSRVQMEKYTCTVCSCDFAFKSDFNKHCILHYREKVFECPYCKKMFRSNHKLNAHIRVHKYREEGCFNVVREVKNKFECDDCKRKFSRKSRLKTHVLAHSGERTHACPICGKTFSRKDHLCSRILIHSERSYQCLECAKNFRRLYHLKRHLVRIHVNTNISCRKRECEIP